MSGNSETNTSRPMESMIEKASAWFSHQRPGRRYAWAGHLFSLVICIYLVFRISQIGWQNIAGSLPASPLFYILSVAIFMVLPLSETRSYRLIAGAPIPDGLRIFTRKKVLNEALVSFSGEAFLSHKLAQLPQFNLRKALIAVKDNNLVSAFVSNTWTIILVSALILAGQPAVLQAIMGISPLLVGGFFSVCILIYFASIIFFRRLSKLSPILLMKIATVHSGKVLITAALQVAQWMCALPAAALTTWLMFLAVQTLIRRIPGLPSTELVFLGVGLSIVGFANETAEQLSAMLIAATITLYFVQLIAYIITVGRRESVANDYM